MAPKLRQSATPLPHDGESPVTVVLPGAQPYGFDFRKKRIFVFLWVFRPIHKGVRYFTDDGTLTSFVAREIPNRFRLFQGVKVLQEPAVSLQPWRKIVLERRCGIKKKKRTTGMER